MKLIASAFGIAVLAAAVVGAQSTEVHEKTKVKVKDGKTITVTGCLERASGGGFLLSDVRSRHESIDAYALTGGEDLDKYIGERVQIKGEASDRGHGKVEVEHETKTSGEKTRHSKSVTEGNNLELPVLGVKQLKKVEGSCR